MSLRILVVDDNIDAADSVRMLLRLKGDHARSAHSGESALELASKFHPDVIFLDLAIPGLNGYQVAERLRGTPAVLVAVSGYGQEQDRRRSMQAGFRHHLLKPVDPHDLTVLLAAIGTGRGPRALDTPTA